MSYFTEPKLIKTRKKHVCHWDGKLLEKGEKVISWSSVGSGYDDMYSIHMHPECFNAMEREASEGEDFSDDLPFASHKRGMTESEWENEQDEE